MLYSLFKHALVPLSKLFINEVNGLQNIPKEEGVIFAINHVSYLDTVLMTTVIADKFHRKLHNLGKTELFESVLGNIFHKAIETIPIKRDSSGEDALKEAIHYLHKGKFISIYPEGGRSRDGQLRRAKTGVARLALRSKKKVIPVGISGTFEIWPANIKIPRLKKIAIINIGKPMEFSNYYNKPITKSLLREISDSIMVEIGKLSGLKYTH